jgi:perosamine synthetase
MPATAEVAPSKLPLEKRVVDALRDILGGQSHALHQPVFSGNEQEYVRECIASTFVSSVGAYVNRFEEQLASFTGAKRAVAVVNGTAALQMALQLAGVRAGDEVLMPSLTFVATANAARYLGAVPHFVDCSEETLGVDPAALRDWLERTTERVTDGTRSRATGRRIAALVPMHTFGHPCDLDGLLAIASDFHIPLVEDAAEALGSTYRGRQAGTFGLLGALSFNGNKIITTGGGGAILTNNNELADLAKHLTTTAKVPHRWEYVHDEVGFNFRMPNINAALGCAQLEQLPAFLDSKRHLAQRYHERLSNISGVRFMAAPPDCESNYWLQTLILDESAADRRDDILAATNDAGFMTRPAWKLIHQLAPYQDSPRAPLPVAESLARRIINLPSSAGLV